MKKNKLFSLAVCAALAAISILCAACPTGSDGLAGAMGGGAPDGSAAPDGSGGGQGGSGAQGGTGTIRIGLGTGSAAGANKSARTAVPDAAELAGITFKVHLTGPGGTIDRDFGPEGGTIDVAAGSWNITVKAYNSEPRLRGLADQTISVAPGGSETIAVTAVIGVKSEAELLDALDTAGSGRYNDSDPSRENLIVVEQDFDIAQFIEIDNPRKYTVIAEPGTTRTIRRQASSGVGACINVRDGVLTLGKAGETGKLVFDGLDTAYLATNAFLHAYGAASVIIDGNTEITRMREIAGYPAIWCESLVEMRGGKITNCVSAAASGVEEGGAVSVLYGGQFIMSGGEISGNSVTATQDAGGGVLMKGGQFIMSGGEISGNSVTAAQAVGGGVLVKSGQFTLSGSGKISGNIASGDGGGVAVLGTSQCIMSGGEISGNSSNSVGGGVVLGGYGIFSMSGVKISGNSSVSHGGGVAVTDHGGFTLNGSAEISGNEVTGTGNSGGGVALTDAGQFDMLGGKISGNTANWAGGGVYLAAATGSSTGSRTFTMDGGIISGNTASTGAGGGVFLGQISGGGGNNDVNTFTMNGGIISENTADNVGGGVYLGASALSGKNIFAKRGGTIGPNTAPSGGKEVYASSGTPPVRTTVADPTVRLYIDITGNVMIDPDDGTNTSSNWT